MRTVIADLFTPLIELLVQPGEKPLQAKFSLYDAARLYLKTCYSAKEIENIPTSAEWLLDGNGPAVASRDPFRISIDKFAYEISRRTATDISDLPIHLKIAPLLFLKDILHEDANNSKRVASFFSKTGMPRYLTELLNDIEIDWDLLSRKDADHTLRHKLFTTLILTLVRLSLTVPGWNALAELALPEVLSHLTALKNPPKQIFIQPATVNTKDTPSFLFANSVDLVMHLCLTLCAKPKWKRISLKILDVVHSHGEMLSQLMRAEIHCHAVETASNLVQQIFNDDEVTRPVIEKEAVLRLLNKRKSDIIRLP
ncbi:unnamed protein product [Auanema sp. JU1783]|nr:unnamed protein product [Auanema sp. JU1783]